MRKKVFEDDIQVAYENENGARITSLKKRPTHDFWGMPYDQPERLNPEDHCYRCNYPKEDNCQNCLLDKALD